LPGLHRPTTAVSCRLKSTRRAMRG
jgi:hypothetical protein